MQQSIDAGVVVRNNGHVESSSAERGSESGNGHAATAAALREQLVRAEQPRIAARPATGFKAMLLRVPLMWKLIGANTVLVLAAALGALFAHHATIAVLAAALIVVIGINHYLVHLALEPLKDLEATASRVWQGDLEARVVPSPIADSDMIRVGSTINLLLDGLMADRSRMRLLAAQVINAQDAERARIARELHDSTAQTLAAAMLQLSAVARKEHDPASQEHLDELRTLVADALEEVRSMSHTIHPRVLDDLGLVAALEWLARQTRQEGVLEVEVEAAPGAESVPKAAASVLYRVAQESVRNVVQHARARNVRIVLDSDGEMAKLSVIDDGHGFDVRSAEARRPGMGLFSIRERVSLVNGTVDIQSVPGRGARVIATVPLGH
jgi:signal transduction histidine kinase